MNTQNKKDKYLNFSGCTQAARFSKALQDGYIQIDEKKYAHNLVYAYGLSKLLNYFNFNDKKEGDWSDFLIDEAVVLAAISFINPADFETSFKINLQKTTSFNKLSKKLLYLEKTYSDIYGMAQKIDAWYQNLKVVEDFINDEVNIRNEIANLIVNKLEEALRKFNSFILGIAQKDTLNISYNFDFSEFSPIWNLDKIEPSTIIFQGKTKSEKINNACNSLQLIFQEFYEAFIYIKQKAQSYLNLSLESDHHFPEVALLLSFLDLYKHPQKQINQLNQRYQEYYYRQILQQSERNAKNAEVFLSFTLDKGVARSVITKGAKFIAGAEESGKHIFFETDYDFEVNGAQLKAMNNLFLEKKSFSDNNSTFNYTNNLYCNNIPIISHKTEKKADSFISYPIFGEKQQGKGDLGRSMQFANIGFAVASPALYLKEGKREIDLVIHFENSAFDALINHIYTFSKYLNISQKEMVVKAFLEAFNIELTASENWIAIKRYVVTLDEKNKALVVKFDVTADQDAIVGFQKDIHNDAYNTLYPVLKVSLNNNSYIYPYTLLKDGNITQVAVNTKVSGVKDLVIQNNVGPVNADNPFLPFGPIPKTGSYMIIGCNEVFQKQLDDISIDIEWFDIPKENQGFSEYYKDYKLGVDNSSYEATISILHEGQWKPDTEEQKQKVKLFRTLNKEDQNEPDAKSEVSPYLTLNNLNINSLKQTPDFGSIPGKQVFNNLSKRGFLKLELTNPMHAFGHDVYPNILSEITLENSKSGFLKGKKTKPLPHAPITPKIKSISISYKSSTVISISDNQTADERILNEHGQLFHLHPFGITKTYPNNSIKDVRLIPNFDFEGALFLGFENVQAPQTISVLFEMLDEFTISSEEEPPEIEWSFLSNNIWHSIKPADIIRDDTNSFLRTGIIMINVPGDIRKSNSILDPDLYWLRVCVKANVEGASNLISVASQVVKATLVGNNELYKSDFLHKDLPAGTIQRPLKTLKGVNKVLQPLPSFHGLPYEPKNKFKTRVSERLRHRNRAVACWDFERLILDNFTQIERATCLPNMTSSNLNSPGNILLVVSPYANNVINTKEPRTSSELLYKIKSFLKNYTSPFANIEVRNPSYERIRVICSVKFKEEHNHGYYIQQLNVHINNYLSGNMGGDSHGSLVGKAVYSSDVITYIRTLPFIQFVTSFSIVQAARDISGNYVLIDTAKDGDEKDGLKATKPWSVLVPSDQHQITVLISKQETSSKQAGIDYLELGSDFIINN